MDLFRWTPDKVEMRERGLDDLMDGWRPAQPFIDAETRVVAFGSCFAARFAQWLIERGMRAQLGDGSDDPLIRTPLESPLAVDHALSWASGEADTADFQWMDRRKRPIEATEERRALLRAMLEQADVLIVTFGVADYWIDTETGHVIGRPPLESNPFVDRIECRTGTVAESSASIRRVIDLRDRLFPACRLIFTVSPQKVAGTFRPCSAITANSAGKATLRAALDEVLRDHPALNDTLFYFPGYEMVTEVLVDPLEDDNVHLQEWHARRIVAAFGRAYSTLVIDEDPGASITDEFIDAHRAVVERADGLQAACDERQAVIDELLAAGDMYRAAIDELRATCDERLSLVDELAATCEARLAVIEELDA
jgi:hypothetical protein